MALVKKCKRLNKIDYFKHTGLGHLIVVKYRRRAISERIQARIKEVAEYINKHNVSVLEFNGEADNVHFLLKTKPNSDMSKFMVVI